MKHTNYELYIASYPTEQGAKEDFESLAAARENGDISVRASAILTRDEKGRVDVKEHVAHSGLKAVGWGAVGGLLAGLFAPELLVVTAAGTVIATTAAGTELASAVAGAATGGVIHELVKRHDEKKLAKDVEEYLPAGSSAIILLVDDLDADRIDRILTRAAKRATRAVDHDDVAKLAKVLDEAGYEVAGVVDTEA